MPWFEVARMVDGVKALPRESAAMRAEEIWTRHGPTTPLKMLILVALPWPIVYTIWCCERRSGRLQKLHRELLGQKFPWLFGGWVQVAIRLNQLHSAQKERPAGPVDPVAP